MHIAFTAAKVATLDCVNEQTINTVAIALIIFRSVDSALSGNRMCSTRRVMKRERINLIAKFSQGCGSRRAGETGANNNYFELALVIRINKFGVSLIVVPLFVQRTIGDFRVQKRVHYLTFTVLRCPRAPQSGMKYCQSQQLMRTQSQTTNAKN